MKVIETTLPDLKIIEANLFNDNRGALTKVFSEKFLTECGLKFLLYENYFSVSKKNVIRGMHFQAPPEDHTKIVYVTFGKIVDVVVDIRKESPTYGQYFCQELTENNHLLMYIPSGFAHGFVSLENNTHVNYLQSSNYSKEHDGGIRFDSFGMDWGINTPILSDRDISFPSLKDFISPFKFKKH